MGKALSKFSSIGILMAILFFIAGSVWAQPGIVWVDDDYSSGSSGGHSWGIDAFANIQAGVNAVASGGIVNVADGTYRENINVTKSCTIQSENGADATFVESNSATDHVFDVRVSNVTIDGFSAYGTSSYPGAGIQLASGTSGATIKNNRCGSEFST